ncbi:MAG: efflux RND transporter periplasmic adaptor subunit [Parcubacteria group bacterium]|jgi:RND family efflux transporter MFP subunit
MQKKQKVIFIVSIFVVTIAGGVAILGFPERGVARQSAEEKAYPVKAIVATAGAFVPQGMYGGFVQGREQSIVSPKINGRLVEMKKHDGDVVHKGDTIALLSADELTQQVLGAQEMISSLGDTLQDTKKYYGQKIDETKSDDTSKEAISSAKKLRTLQMQNVQNGIVEAQSNLRVAQSLAKETIVRAPFDGVIIRTFQDDGQIVGSTTPIFEIADRTEMKVEIFVAQDVMQSLEIGDPVAISSDESDESEEFFAGTVTAVGLRAQSSGQQARITVRVDDPTHVQLGQYVTVRLPQDDVRDDVIMVPENAIVQKYDDMFVFVVEDDVAVQKKVTLGATGDDMVEIASGISAGDRVIVEGMYTIKDRYHVHIYE